VPTVQYCAIRAAASEAELGLPNAECTGGGLFAHKSHAQKQQQQPQQSIALDDERQYELPLKDIIQVSNLVGDAFMIVHSSKLWQHIVACTACYAKPLVPNATAVYSHS
jgi:hypothetical protein